MDGYLTIEELAAKLKVSKGYIYNLCYRGKIPYKKIGRLVRFDPAEVRQWIESNSRRMAEHGKRL